MELAHGNERWAFVIICQKLKTKCLILQASAQYKAVQRESHGPSSVSREYPLKEKHEATRVKNVDCGTKVGMESSAFYDIHNGSENIEMYKIALCNN